MGEKYMEKWQNSIIHGNCKEVLTKLPDNFIDAVVTDPPYELGFMNKKWDKSGITYDAEIWKRVRRVLKPGGYLISFGGARTYHRMVCAIEDAGFIIHPMIGWISGEGFPKAVDLSKQFDQQACRKELTKELGRKPNREEFKKAWENYRKIVGVKNNTYDNSVRNPNKHKSPAELSNIGEWGLKKTPHGLPLTTPVTPEAQQWIGWYYGLQSLKPAIEPICMAQKPIDSKRMTDNVLKWGTGGLNIDGCRIGTDIVGWGGRPSSGYSGGLDTDTSGKHRPVEGRFPANVILDEEAGRLLDEQSGISKSKKSMRGIGFSNSNVYGKGNKDFDTMRGYNDSGGASRYFKNIEYDKFDFIPFLYCPKASKKERTCDGQVENKHPTVKPIKLMRYLCKLVTPSGGVILDPFCGSGSTLVAAKKEGFSYIGIEQDLSNVEIAKQRIKFGVDILYC